MINYTYDPEDVFYNLICVESAVKFYPSIQQYNVSISRVPCTKVLSQEIQIFQETSFCVLQVLLRNFTNTLWQLYIDFYTIRMVFESSFQLCTFKVANLKKLLAILAKMCSSIFRRLITFPVLRN